MPAFGQVITGHDICHIRIMMSHVTVHAFASTATCAKMKERKQYAKSFFGKGGRGDLPIT